MREPPPVGADAPEPPRATLAARIGWLSTRARLRGRLRVEGRTSVGRGVRITIAPGATVTLADGVELGAQTRIAALAGDVRIGPGTRVGERCTLAATAGIAIGASCAIGDYVVVTDSDPGTADVETPLRLQPLRRAAVRVGDGARLGAHAAVLAGALVGDGTVVGSYAVVRGAVPRGAVVTATGRYTRARISSS